MFTIRRSTPPVSRKVFKPLTLLKVGNGPIDRRATDAFRVRRFRPCVVGSFPGPSVPKPLFHAVDDPASLHSAARKALNRMHYEVEKLFLRDPHMLHSTDHTSPLG